MDKVKTNSKEYDDPILYDKENDEYIEDLSYLMKWASRSEGLPIIDLACGTGRATIPLVSLGYKLVGVDIHKGMLCEARKKSSKLELQIEWVEQDCTKFNLYVKSNLIFSVGKSFQHFLSNEEQDGILSSVNKHLEMGGVFINDIYELIYVCKKVKNLT
ncbi:class I SAM-dependent methyltransferase [Cytobacillus firmus]|nr:class I SAM-dependent methyltransferase [Cytobacillus firmus]